MARALLSGKLEFVGCHGDGAKSGRTQCAGGGGGTKGCGKGSREGDRFSQAGLTALVCSMSVGCVLASLEEVGPVGEVWAGAWLKGVEGSRCE